MFSAPRFGRIALGTLATCAVTVTACKDSVAPDQKGIKQPGSAAYAAAGQPAGLMAAYGFNETSGSTVADVSSNNNTGTLGSGVTRAAAGKFGGALSFNGSGRVTIPNNASLALVNGATLEAWVNPSAVNSAWRDVVYKGNDNYYLMATSSRSPRPVAGITRASSVGNPTETFGSATLASNTWTHLALTYDGSTVRLYVNGAQVSSAAASGTILTSTQPLTIGGDPIYGQGFQGLIDEVRVYNRALSVDEIRTDMNTAISDATPPADTTKPTVAITSPTSSSTYTTTTNTLSLSGSAADNVGVAEVTWANSRGGSGTATGTASWSVANVPLQMGTNVMTVSARDAANNVAVDTLTVTLSGSGSGSAGLVAAYSFDEASGSNALDASVNGNTGSLGANVTRVASGKFGGALTFNGGMVTIPNSSSIALSTAMTIEAWVNPSSMSSAWVDILNKGRDDYYLMASSTRGPQPVGAVTFAGDNSSTGAFSATALPANKWTHVAATYDGSAMHLYMDGAEVGSFVGEDAIATSTAPLTIGGDPIFGQWFRGLIDEVRIYNRALSATQIANDMATPIGGGSTTPPPSDTSAPTIAITSPTGSGSYTTTSATVNLSGTASDNVGVTLVSWSSSRGGSGTASGTANWTANAVGLQSGTNVISMTARDGAGNVGTTSITVTYNAPANPTPTALSITTQPSSSATSGQAFAQQPVIQLRDASNAAVAKSGVVVTAAILSGGGTLGGTTSATTNASGVATFTNLSITGSDGSRALSFASSGLTSATSNAISVSSATTPPPANGEPVFDPSTQTMVYQDNMDQYTSATAMGAAGQTGPRITPNPSPMTTSSAVQTNENAVITGRGGSGKALRLTFSGGNQTSATFITWNMPSTPTLATHYFQYYGRVNFSQPFSGVLAVKWFEAWHVHQDRVQWNTHDHLPCKTDGAHATYWQVYDQSRETTCQGNQPVGPYFNDIADNQWHRFTYQYRPNSSAGARDGFARMWVDGVKVIDVSKATIGVTPTGGEKPWCLADDVDNLAVNDGMFNQFWGSTQTTPTPSWTYDVDDYKWWITP